MDLQADGVAEAVAEAALIAGFVDQFPGGLIHRAAGNADLRRPDAEALRIQHRLIHPAHLLGRLPNGDGTGHIRAIASPGGSVIQSEEVAGLQGPVPRDGVRFGGIRSAGGNGLKRQAVSPAAAHTVFQVGGNLLFGLAGLDEIQDIQKSGIGDSLRLLDTLQLLRLLDGAHRQDRIIQSAFR